MSLHLIAVISGDCGLLAGATAGFDVLNSSLASVDTAAKCLRSVLDS